MSRYKLGIIGGSGLYNLEKYTNAKSIDISTSWGKPSGQVIQIEHDGKEIFFYRDMAKITTFSLHP
ncbi:MAG: hypothetical protein HOM30_04810 [Gammaproteobacteria bacterium]|nr:hypothetical protein [Gammaproteobacteria bacterium]